MLRVETVSAEIELGFVERISQCGDKTLLCLDLKAYSREEPILCEPLNSCLPGITEEPDFLGPATSKWVLQKVMGACHEVGL